MHGLIFFYIHKFAERSSAALAARSGSGSGSPPGRTYLPSGVYPDADAVALLEEIADSVGRPLGDVVLEFGEFLAPHLVNVADTLIEPGWRTLDLIEHTEAIIHTMVRAKNPGASPPVLEALRASPDELHVVYSSKRRLCILATGIVRGLATHYGERIVVEEPSCMHRGDAFCSFVIRHEHGDTHPSHSPLTATIASEADLSSLSDPGVVVDGPPPRQIGGYDVLGLIGSGAMGRVFLANDPRLERRVAIKVMNDRHASNPAARQRFLRESRSVA